MSRDRQATLESVYGRFALALQAALSSRLRVTSEVFVSSVEQTTFAEFTVSRANPCAAFVFALRQDSASFGVIDLGVELAYYMVDRLFGGPGDPTDIKRPITNLERLLIGGLTEKFLGMLAEAWDGILPLAPANVTFESIPDTIQALNVEDHVLVANVEIRCGQFAGTIAICLPLKALEGFLQEKSARLHGATPSEALRQQARGRIEKAVRNASLPVSVRLPAFTMRTRELAFVESGKIIYTGHSIDTPVEVHVCSERRFVGTMGRVRRQLALQVTQRTTDTASQAVPRGWIQ